MRAPRAAWKGNKKCWGWVAEYPVAVKTPVTNQRMQESVSPVHCLAGTIVYLSNK